jgi:hypothetical protein
VTSNKVELRRGFHFIGILWLLSRGRAEWLLGGRGTLISGPTLAAPAPKEMWIKHDSFLDIQAVIF